MNFLQFQFKFFSPIKFKFVNYFKFKDKNPFIFILIVNKGDNDDAT